MSTFGLGSPPPGLEALLQRRRRAGAHNVDEVLVLEPAKGTVTWLALAEGEYRPVERSGLIDLGRAGLAEHLGWP